MDVKKTLSALPRKTGVYIFKDSSGRIIYIGKANNIYNRVRSYYQKNDSTDNLYHIISYFVGKINSIDYVVTDNEIEALILESNLIKRNRPKYNISFKDDKSYPFIAITEKEKFPRIFITRDRNIKAARYFGPYTNVNAANQTLEILRRIFKIRDCRKSKPGKAAGMPCLNYHINLCSAPCTGNVSEEKYRDNINYIKLFLKGRDSAVINILKSEIQKHVKDEEFEKAAEIKEKIDSINKLVISQKIFIYRKNSCDAVSISKDTDESMAAVSLFSYREGELIAVNNFVINNIKHLKDKEILSGFIKKYYTDIDNMPSKIYVPFKVEDMSIISKWFEDTKGKKIEIKIPKKGEKKKIIDMVTKNSKLYLNKKKFEKDVGSSKVYKHMLKLKEVLGLANIPRRVECFDISNLKNSFPVGSMVVFVDGNPLNSNYRHFKINTVSGQDDCRMIEEIITRRLKYLKGSKINIEDSFYIKPDLMVIDGGKAQFNAACNVLRQKGIFNIDVISIAKKEEIIFCNKYIRGIKLDKNSNFMMIVTKIRDESHRFAVNYHRKLRDRYMTNSILDGIKGIGEKKKYYIFEKINSIDELKSSSIRDLLNIKGLSYRDAVNVYNSFHK